MLFYLCFSGVVQLFNAVKNHQKKLEEKLKCAKTENKKEQVEFFVSCNHTTWYATIIKMIKIIFLPK